MIVVASFRVDAALLRESVTLAVTPFVPLAVVAILRGVDVEV